MVKTNKYFMGKTCVAEFCMETDDVTAVIAVVLYSLCDRKNCITNLYDILNKNLFNNSDHSDLHKAINPFLFSIDIVMLVRRLSHRMSVILDSFRNVT